MLILSKDLNNFSYIEAQKKKNKLTFSIQRVSMTIALELVSQTIRQKSSLVEAKAPWVTTNSRGELKPCGK